MNKVLLYLFSTIILLGCGDNEKIVTSSNRELVPEPDKELRIKNDVRQTLQQLIKQINSSDSIELCQSGQKIIESGHEILPYLKEEFHDSTTTNVYSTFNKRNLTVGETAIILSNSIKQVPIFQVVRVHQCIPPFETDIEFFLERIKHRPKSFYENYTNWIDTLVFD